jgi:hypothetical protein
MVESLRKTFSTNGIFETDAVKSVPSRPLRPWLDNPFSEHEVTAAVWKMTNDSLQEIANVPPLITKHF